MKNIFKTKTKLLLALPLSVFLLSAVSPGLTYAVDNYPTLPVVSTFQENSVKVHHASGKRVKDRANKKINAWQSDPKRLNSVIWQAPASRTLRNNVQYEACIKVRALGGPAVFSTDLTFDQGGITKSAGMGIERPEASTIYQPYCKSFIKYADATKYQQTVTVTSGRILIDKSYTRKLCTIKNSTCALDGR